MFEAFATSGGASLPQSSGQTDRIVGCRGAIHAVRLKQKSKTKRKRKSPPQSTNTKQTADGEWGQISFDFENGTSEIVRLADWDTMKTNRFANKAIAYLNCETKLPKQ